MTKECVANILAQNLLEQVDAEGFGNAFFTGIVDHSSDELAVKKAERFVVTERGCRE